MATCQSASRAIVGPTARVSRTAVSKSIAPTLTAPTSVLSATRSASVNAAAVAGVGEAERPPQPAGLLAAVTPAASATSSLVSAGVSPRIACSSCSRAGSGSGSVIELAYPSVGSGPVAGPAGLEEQVADLQMDLLDVRDVVQLDPALLAGVGDHQGAAAEQPVERALLVGTSLIRVSGMSWPARG